MSAYAVIDKVKDAHENNDIVLLKAATGSGKTILIPQTLLELCGCATVTCTQPRRAPVFGAHGYVGEMMGNVRVGCAVGGQVNPNPDAPLQYVTDGMMMGRLLASGSFTVGNKQKPITSAGTTPPGSLATLVIDEAHERSSVMDLVYLTACKQLQELKKKKSAGGAAGGRRVVLASATLCQESEDFYVNTAKSFGLKIAIVELPGGTQYPITETAHPTLMATDDNTRAQLAATDAWTIMQADPKKHKVLVFLPNKSEIFDATNKFKSFSAGKVSCAALHAQVSDLSAAATNNSVLFSNQIAEASLTVKGLTHVLDFNVNMRAEIDDAIHCHTLAVSMSTVASKTQRQGRVGRQQPGFYKSYSDLTKLEPGYPQSFELLSNDELLQYEIRVRHFLKSTLFKGNLDGLPTLGLGIAPRGTFDIAKQHIPTDPKELAIVATLGLSGGMATALRDDGL
jgi:ATP-dependent helicase HrpB